MKVCTIVLLAGASLLASGASVAGPEKFESRGFISNDAGEKCWYRQEIIPDAIYFHGDSIATTIGEIVFDDPQCMSDSGEGLDATKTMINEVISAWYSHPDADFDTKNLRKAGLHQEVGRCIQSRSYTAIAITIDYVVSNQSITKVVHGPALEGCIS